MLPLSAYLVCVARFIELYANLVDFDPGTTWHGTATSMYVRSAAMYEGMLTILANPLFGIGLGQAPITYTSGFLQLAAESGIPAVLMYYGFVGVVLLRLRRCKGIEISLVTFLIAAIFADSFNGLITHNLFHLQRWLLMSLVISWLHARRDT